MSGPPSQTTARTAPQPPVPQPQAPQARLEELLGADLSRFLVGALTANQGRRGSSSP